MKVTPTKICQLVLKKKKNRERPRNENQRE